MSGRRSWGARLDAVLLPAVRRVLRALLALPVRPLWALVAWERDAARPPAVRRVAAQPGAVALLAALVVFVGSAVHLQRFDPGPPDVADAQVAVALPGQPGPAEAGPRDGVDLDLYAAGRRAALDDLDDDLEIRAVVSFAQRRPAAEVTLPSAVVVERVAVRLPVEGEPPEQLDVGPATPVEALEAFLDAERDRLAEEEDELRSLLTSDVDDPAFEEEFARRADELAALREALSPDAALVHAVVVVGPVGALRELHEAAGVRLVDPVGAVRETAETRVHGLLPEDADRASHGRSL